MALGAWLTPGGSALTPFLFAEVAEPSLPAPRPIPALPPVDPRPPARPAVPTKEKPLEDEKSPAVLTKSPRAELCGAAEAVTCEFFPGCPCPGLGRLSSKSRAQVGTRLLLALFLPTSKLGASLSHLERRKGRAGSGAVPVPSEGERGQPELLWEGLVGVLWVPGWGEG